MSLDSHLSSPRTRVWRKGKTLVVLWTGLLAACTAISRDELPALDPSPGVTATDVPLSSATPATPTPTVSGSSETPLLATPTQAPGFTSSPGGESPTAVSETSPTPPLPVTDTPAAVTPTPGESTPTQTPGMTPSGSPSPTLGPDPSSSPVVSPAPSPTPEPTPIVDLDLDGYGVGADCNDSNTAVHPGATEVCNGVDDNCSGAADEGAGYVWYADGDRDDVGASGVTTMACEQPKGYVPDGGDCNDLDPAINPKATEICNGVDDNCSGSVDEDIATQSWYHDGDGDGYGNPSSMTLSCQQPVGYVADGTDCSDTSAEIHPGAPEQCNAVDDNCNAQIDESVSATWYQDQDGDGYGTSSVTTQSCTQPSRYSSVAGDCNDANANVNPGATELCSQVADQNCDGQLPPTCQSCAERHADYPNNPSGLYTIDPDGVGGLGLLEVYCDMSYAGGGFTLLQRTVWDWTDSLKLNTGIAGWKDVLIGAPNVGYAYRMKGTAWSALTMGGEVLLKVTLRRGNGKDCLPLFYRASGASFTLSASSATATALTGISTSGLAYEGTELSTTDSGPFSSQVSTTGGTGNWPVPWFYSSKPMFFPAYDENLWSDQSPHPAINASAPADSGGLTPLNACASGSPVLSSNGLYAASLMEFYVR